MMNRLFWVLLKITGLYDRLHCPSCGAVGTYKFHAPSPSDTGPRPFRWMCKYCGFYRGPEGTGRLVYPSTNKKVWAFLSDDLGDSVKDTPIEVIRKAYGYDVWPWRG